MISFRYFYCQKNHKLIGMKKRIIPIIFTGIIVGIMLFSACEKVVFPPVEIIIPDTTDSVTVSYLLDIQPIWDDKCVNCHGRDPDLHPDVSYDALISGGYINTEDPASSELITKLYGTHDSRATEEEKQLILLWIAKGAEDN